jgi:hypothetical protein
MEAAGVHLGCSRRVKQLASIRRCQAPVPGIGTGGFSSLSSCTSWPASASRYEEKTSHTTWPPSRRRTGSGLASE